MLYGSGKNVVLLGDSLAIRHDPMISPDCNESHCPHPPGHPNPLWPGE